MIFHYWIGHHKMKVIAKPNTHLKEDFASWHAAMQSSINYHYRTSDGSQDICCYRALAN